MSSAPPTDERASATGLPLDPAATAARLREAGFVRLVALPDGDALAAAGLLADALREAGVPFRASVDAPARAPTPADAGDDGALVRLGGRPDDPADADAVLPGDGPPASVAAHAVAAELGGSPAPTLALAGAVAAGTTPGADGTAPLLEAAERAGAVERRPGVAVPLADLEDGLAHATLVRGPFSGDPERVRERLALPGDGGGATTDREGERRRIASLVAVEVATAPDAPPRAAEAVEDLLRPYATPAGPFATLGGWADVLCAVAGERPGAGVALAVGDRTGDDGDGYDPRTTALSAWRAHGRAVHGLLDDATTGRYDGLLVVRADETTPGRARTAARLVRDFRSPEPAVLVVCDGALAAAATSRRTVDAIADAVAPVAGGSGGDGILATGGDRTATGPFDGDVREAIAAVREVAG